MFSNGDPHENQKTFLMAICKIAQESKIFDTSVKLIKEYSTIWQNAGKMCLFVGLGLLQYPAYLLFPAFGVSLILAVSTCDQSPDSFAPFLLCHYGGPSKNLFRGMR